MATRLHAAGYRTGLFGKYLNGYKNTTNSPPGWDRWFAHVGAPHYFDYDVNDQGTIRHFGTKDSDYETDVIAGQTNELHRHHRAARAALLRLRGTQAPRTSPPPRPRATRTPTTA